MLLEHGVLHGFRRGWRKHYVEFLDASVPALLAAMIEAGGEVPLIAIQDSAWEQVAGIYGHDLDDAAERRHVDRLVQAIIAQLADLGAAERHNQDVRLTELGGGSGYRRKHDHQRRLRIARTRLSRNRHRTGSRGRPATACAAANADPPHASPGPF